MIFLSFSQILREVFFGDNKLLHFVKAKNDQKIKKGDSKLPKKGILEFLGSQRLISRKICLCNYLENSVLLPEVQANPRT